MTKESNSIKLSKKAFSFYRSYHDMMPHFTDKQLGEFMRALSSVMFFDKHIDDVEFKDSSLTIFWASIKYQVKTSIDGFAAKKAIDYNDLITPYTPPWQGAYVPPSQQVEEKGKVEEQEKEKEKGQVGHFDIFWEAYPKGHKKSKKNTRLKWPSIANKFDVIIADIEKRKLEDDRWKSGFIPDALVYLNQERWDGDIYKDNTKQASKSGVPRDDFASQDYTKEF